MTMGMKDKTQIDRNSMKRQVIGGLLALMVLVIAPCFGLSENGEAPSASPSVILENEPKQTEVLNSVGTPVPLVPTEAPIATEAPVETEAPEAATVAPVAAETPVETEAPEATTEAPIATEAPVATEAPLAVESASQPEDSQNHGGAGADESVGAEQPALMMASSAQPLLTAAAGSETGAVKAGDAAAAAGGGEPYAVPEGSAYLMINGLKISDMTYTNDAKGNAIQNALADAVKYIESDLKQVTVVVQKGVYQGGLDMGAKEEDGTLLGLIYNAIKHNAGGGEDASVILGIVAEDAMTVEEETNSVSYHANGSGSAQVEGDISAQGFSGFNLVMAGLYMATRNLVNISGADHVAYYGTTQNDRVDLNLQNITDGIAVDLGNGNDQLALTIHQAPTVNISVDASFVEAAAGLTTLDPAAAPAELAEQVRQFANQINQSVSGKVSPPPHDAGYGEGRQGE